MYSIVTLGIKIIGIFPINLNGNEHIIFIDNGQIRYNVNLSLLFVAIEPLSYYTFDT